MKPKTKSLSDEKIRTHNLNMEDGKTYIVEISSNGDLKRFDEIKKNCKSCLI